MEKEDDFKDYIAKETRRTTKLVCDHQLKNCKQGDIIQLQRKGYYRVDQPYIPADGATFQETPAVSNTIVVFINPTNIFCECRKLNKLQAI